MKKTEIRLPATHNKLQKVVCLPTKNGLHKISIYFDDKTVILPNVGFTDISTEWNYGKYAEVPEITLTGAILPSEDEGKSLVHTITCEEETSSTPKKRMTIAEIERELGYAIEVIGDE